MNDLAHGRPADASDPTRTARGATSPRRPGGPRRLLPLAALALLVGLAALLWGRFGGPAPAAVAALGVERGDLAATIELLGTVINDRTVTITALLDGRLTAIEAREGDAVEAGEALATLDVREATTRLAKAKAELELARRRLASAEREDERLRGLSRNGATTRQTVDDTADALDDARLSLAVAEFDVVLMRLALDDAVIGAPFAGTVIEQSAETGQWVEAGTPLFRLVASDGTVIEAEVDAGDSARVALGLPVTLSSDAWPERTWRSAVSWIAPDVRGETTNRFAVRLPLGADAPPLKLGQRVDLALEIERVEGVATLPLDALVEHAPGRYHAFVLEAGRARRVDVEVGLVTIDAAEIVAGVADDALVLVPGDVELEDGMAVRVTSAP